MFEALKRNLGLSPVVRNVEQPVHSVQQPKQTSTPSVPKDEYKNVDEQSSEHACAEYRTLMSGVRFESRDGRNHVNGIDVEKLLKLYALRPTSQAEQYLRGVQSKVHLLLREQSNIKNHERLLEVSQNITRVIQESSRHTSLRLLADRNSTVS